MNYKITIIGKPGVGKTTFLQKHLTGEFINDYIPSTKPEYGKLTFNSNYGNVNFDCHIGTIKKCDAVILMVDDSDSDFDVTHYSNYIINKFVVFVYTKSVYDMSDKYSKIKLCKLINNSKTYAFLTISTKTGLNFNLPFLKIAKELSRHLDLEFYKTPSPTQINICEKEDNKICFKTNVKVFKTIINAIDNESIQDLIKSRGIVRDVEKSKICLMLDIKLFKTIVNIMDDESILDLIDYI